MDPDTRTAFVRFALVAITSAFAASVWAAGLLTHAC
jgi:hypothetical protein